MAQSSADSRHNSSMRHRRDTMNQSEMGGNKFKYDDDDDYGIPKLVATTRRPLIQRLRIPAIIAACIFLFFIWMRTEPSDPTDWSRFAYVQYVTDSHTMCNAFMVFEALQRLGSKADRVLLYPSDWNAETLDPNDRNSQLLIQAKKSYGVKLRPIQLLGLDGPAEPGTMKTPSGFESSITKLRIWELDEYERIIHFDADVTVQQHLDELFSLPPAPIALTQQYWSDRPRDQWPLSTQLMVIQPNAAETKNLWDRLQKWRLDPYLLPSQHYDIDLINDRFAGSAMILPHKNYLLQTNEFRMHDHNAYMGTFNAPENAVKWDPFRAVKEAKLIHFDDWPVPKPWIMWPNEALVEFQPDCGGAHTGTCGDREMWKSLYDDFRHKRKDVCKILSVPAPNWNEWQISVGYKSNVSETKGGDKAT